MQSIERKTSWWPRDICRHEIIRFSALLFGMAFLPLGSVAPAHADERLFRNVNLPLNVAVVHQESFLRSGDFFSALVDRDYGGLVSEERETDMASADVMVFNLPTWNAAPTIPFFSALRGLYETVSDLPVEADGFTAKVIFNDGRQMGLVFLSQESPPHGELACGATIFFLALGFGFDGGRIDLADGATC